MYLPTRKIASMIELLPVVSLNTESAHKQTTKLPSANLKRNNKSKVHHIENYRSEGKQCRSR